MTTEFCCRAFYAWLMESRMKVIPNPNAQPLYSPLLVREGEKHPDSYEQVRVCPFCGERFEPVIRSPHQVVIHAPCLDPEDANQIRKILGAEL